MLAPPMATVPVQLVVYRSSFSWPGRYGITPSPLRLYSVVRRRLAFTLPSPSPRCGRKAVPTGPFRPVRPGIPITSLRSAPRTRLRYL